ARGERRDAVHAGVALAGRVASAARAGRLSGDRLLRLVRPKAVPRRRGHRLDRPPAAVTVFRQVPGTVPRTRPFRTRPALEAASLLKLRLTTVPFGQCPRDCPSDTAETDRSRWLEKLDLVADGDFARFDDSGQHAPPVVQ